MEVNTPNDNDREQMFQILGMFSFYMGNGLNPNEAYNAVVADYNNPPPGDILHQQPPVNLPAIMARAALMGHIPGIQPEDGFFYRVEMILIGLHMDRMRGINVTHAANGILVANCLVAVFNLHNRRDPNTGDFIYGGEEGHLSAANAIRVRVLDDQRASMRNLALINAINERNLIRLVISQRRQEPRNEYVLDGLYTANDFDIVQTNEGFTVYQYTLGRWPE